MEIDEMTAPISDMLANLLGAGGDPDRKQIQKELNEKHKIKELSIEGELVIEELGQCAQQILNNFEDDLSDLSEDITKLFQTVEQSPDKLRKLCLKTARIKLLYSIDSIEKQLQLHEKRMAKRAAEVAEHERTCPDCIAIKN